MASFLTLDDLDAAGRRVFLRADLNVPMADGRVTDTTRIDRLVPTVEELIRRRSRIVLASHFGRPGGRVVPALSLAPLVAPLRDALGGRPVGFADDCVGEAAERAVAELGEGEIVLLENLRFHPGEEANDAGFAAALARLAERYVNDAFSCAHRAAASVVALPALLPAAAGRLMEAELGALERALGAPARPVGAVVGGAKVSTKLGVLRHLLGRVDVLIIGGGMANTFLAARGLPVGRSLCEHEMADTAREILADAERRGCAIALPLDAVVAPALEPGVRTETVAVDAVPDDAMILDVGPATVAELEARIDGLRTLVWNGPLGAFEVPPFDAGTNRVAAAAARRTGEGRLVSVAGGGDTVAALVHAGVADRFTYVSTAGGAFLEWLEGRTLPGVAALEAAAARAAAR